jgi:hypothetical protein
MNVSKGRNLILNGFTSLIFSSVILKVFSCSENNCKNGQYELLCSWGEKLGKQRKITRGQAPVPLNAET